jgi:hypothetical protein
MHFFLLELCSDGLMMHRCLNKVDNALLVVYNHVLSTRM